MKALELNKERIYLCAPFSSISTVVTIEGEWDINRISAAIREAAAKHEILRTRIRIAEDGSAFYEEGSLREIIVEIRDGIWQELVEEQMKIRFEIENGEWIRFFLLPTQVQLQLVILSHHLAGDGLSIAYLVESIMDCLIGKDVPEKPVKLMDLDAIPGSLNPFIRFLVKRVNRIWHQNGRVFQFPDIKRVFAQYWENRRVSIFSQTISAETLIRFAKQNQITVNSLLLTAVYQAVQSKAGIGISVSLRGKEDRHMGNFSTGVTIPYRYQDKKPFSENAREVHKRIASCLHDDNKKYFLMRFMKELPKTLIDAVYFSVFDHDQNKAAQMAAKLFGYCENPQGMNIANLTRLPIPVDYGHYHLSNYICIPPLMPNLKMVFGIATIGDSLTITLCTKDSNRELFDKVIQILGNCC